MTIWKQAFANSKRTSCVSDGPSETALSCQWYVAFEPYIHPYVQPITDGSDLFIATSSGLFKIVTADQTIGWRISGRFACTPAYDAGFIYAADTTGRVRKIAADSGEARWTWGGAEAGFDADVLLSTDGSKVIVGSRDGRLYCLAAATGALMWQYPTTGASPLGPIDSGAAEHDGHVYFLSNDCHVRRLNLANGTLEATSAKVHGEGFRWMPPVVDASDRLLFVPLTPPLVKQQQGWDDHLSWKSREQMDFWGAETCPSLEYVAGAETGGDGPWPAGALVLDMSVAEGTKDAPTTYVSKHPQRITMLVLNLEDLSEHTMDGGGRTPFMASHTYTGNRFPCAISDDGAVYADAWYRAREGDAHIFDAAISAWKKGTPQFAPIQNHASDEPMWFTLGKDGACLYTSLTMSRQFATVNLTDFTSTTHIPYDQIGAVAPGIEASYGGEARTGSGWAYHGANGVYGIHQFTALPIPVGSKVYLLIGNSLAEFDTPAHTPTAPARTVEAVTEEQAASTQTHIATLEAVVQATVAAGHISPGWVSHQLLDFTLQDPQRWQPFGTAYGKYAFDTLTPMLWAFPHVSSTLQAQIAAYCTAEAQFTPWGTIAQYASPDTGSAYTPRGWADVDPDARLDEDGGSWFTADETRPYSAHPMFWYLAWQMHAVMGADARALYEKLRDDSLYANDYRLIQAGKYNAVFVERPFILNAHLAGLYGRWQLALAAGAAAEAATAKSVLDAGIAFWNNNFDKDTPYEADQLDERRSERTQTVARWWLYLTPEVAGILQSDDGYSQGAIDEAIAEMERNAAFWDLRGFPGTLNECGTHPFHDYQALFAAKALLQNTAKPDLARHLDAPIFAVGDYQYIANLALYAAAAGVEQTLEILALRVLTPDPIQRFGRFEAAFELLGASFTNPYYPFDSDPPPGIDRATGISVDAELLPPGQSDWAHAMTAPCFYYQPVKQVAGKLTPSGAAEWRFRFSTGLPGEWRYRIKAIDAGDATTSDVGSFTVTPTGNAGYVRINEHGLFETSDGKPFNDPLVNLGGGFWPWSTATSTREQLTALAAAGVRFMRWFPTGEAGANITPFGDDMTSSWGFGNGRVTRDELDQGCSWSFVPYFYSYQRTALQRDLDYAFQFRVKVTGSRQVTFRITEESGRELVSKTLQGPLDWETYTIFFNSGGGGDVIIWMVNGVAEEDDTEGAPYVSSIGLRATEDNKAGPNILARSHPDTYRYVDAVGAAYLDLVLEESTARGVYHRLTLFHKNDRILCALQPDGQWGDWAVNNFYAAHGQAARWLGLAYVRYFVARWGYSPAIHSLELANENMLESVSYDAAFAIAEYIRDNAPRAILQSNSFWGWYVDPFWADSTRADLMDCADKHWYESTKPAGDAGELVGADWADSAASVRKAYRRFLQYEARFRPKQPILRGETGTFDETGVHPLLASDTRGIYLHKMLWANTGCVRHGVAGEWFANLIDGNKLWTHFGAYRAFIADEPLNSGTYEGIGSDLEGDAAVLVNMTTGELRAWGQRHNQRNRVILWVDNPSHTWVNDVNQANLVPATGTIGLQDLEPGRYEIQYWDTTSGKVTGTVVSDSTTRGRLSIRLANLSTDTALKIYRVSPLPPPPPPESDEEIIRALAWKGLFPGEGVQLDADGAFATVAGQRELGLPVTNELAYQDWRIQGFAGGILYMAAGKPEEMRLLAW